ncbi:MAG: hypothetical protein ABSF69_15235, partial [Polyangiaceae bacterium]
RLHGLLAVGHRLAVANWPSHLAMAPTALWHVRVFVFSTACALYENSLLIAVHGDLLMGTSPASMSGNT